MSRTSLAPRKVVSIMQKKVVVVGPTDSLDEAMMLMTEQHVTGLPVLDHEDHCIGVIAASDILNFVGEQSKPNHV